MPFRGKRGFSGSGRENKLEVEQDDHREVITCDALIVSTAKHWPVACVCFGDGQIEAVYGKVGRATWRIREGQRAGRARRGEWREDGKLKGVIKSVKEHSVA